VHGAAEGQGRPDPSLRWRVVAGFSLLALPERYDAWSAARVRQRQTQLAGLRAAPAMLAVLAVLTLGGVRARIGPAILAVVLVPVAILFVIVVIVMPRQTRKLLELLDHPPDQPRTSTGRRWRGWLCVGAAAFNFTNLGIQAAVPGTPIHEMTVAAMRGPGCHAPTAGERARVREALAPTTSAADLAVVWAGRTRAVAMHVTDSTSGVPNQRQEDFVLLLDSAARFNLPAIFVTESTTPVALATSVPQAPGFEWRGFYRNPIPVALACSRRSRSELAVHLD